jgi:rubredoxin
MSDTEMHSYKCHACGYDGFKAGTSEDTLRLIDAGVVGPIQWFCPVCKTELVRDDALGNIEAEAGLRKFNPDDYDGVIEAKL